MTESGTVKWFNFSKGYGFIAPKNEEEDIFVHAKGVKGNPLKEGDEVTYELVDDEKSGKKCAEKVEGGSGYPSKGKGKGKGRVRPGDWTCPECKVNNFASRDACFKCETAKPADAEE